MSRFGVMHMIDSLAIGGAEQMAVNLVNLLPREVFRVHLCTTRHEGPLAAAISDDVERLSLMRSTRFDIAALRRFADYCQEHGIQLLHAHSTSLFFATLASFLRPHPLVIWHDHNFGRSLRHRRAWIYRPAARHAAATIVVTHDLLRWSREQLGIPAGRVTYIPNFTCPAVHSHSTPELPGERGGRIICLAHWREQKDHLTLLRAFDIVRHQVPAAHLLLVGTVHDDVYGSQVRRERSVLQLEESVSVLGCREDVAAVLLGCDIGVLSSISEGLPLAILEYGWAGLPVVATRVGQCAEVLADGRAGRLVPPGSPEELAGALLKLLTSAEERRMLGAALAKRVRDVYSPERGVAAVCRVYEAVLGCKDQRKEAAMLARGPVVSW